jgi:Sigma-70 factor, region 1.1
VTWVELNELLAAEVFSPEQIDGVLDQLFQIGITVMGKIEAMEEGQSRVTGRGIENHPIRYSSVCEGCWDGKGWPTAGVESALVVEIC